MSTRTREKRRGMVSALLSCALLLTLLVVITHGSFGENTGDLSDAEIEKRLTTIIEVTKEDWRFSDKLKELEERLAGNQALLQQEKEKLEQEHAKNIEQLLGGITVQKVTEQFSELLEDITALNAFLERHPDIAQRLKDYEQEISGRRLKSLRPEERTLSDAELDKYVPVWLELTEITVEQKRRVKILKEQFGADKERLQREEEKVVDELRGKWSQLLERAGITSVEFIRLVDRISLNRARVDRYIETHPDLKHRHEKVKQEASELKGFIFVK